MAAKVSSALQLVQVKPQCEECGKTGGDLFSIECTHLTLCAGCGKAMALQGASCFACGAPICKLIKEYGVRLGSRERQYTITKFPQGLPGFRGAQGADKEWTLTRAKKGGRDPVRAQQDKLWMLEDDTKHSSYRGTPEAGTKHAAHFLFIRQPKRHDFDAVPVSNWILFKKIPNIKQVVSADKVEEQMEKQRKSFALKSQKYIRVKDGDEEEEGGGKGMGARSGRSGRKGAGDDDGEEGGGRGRRAGGEDEEEGFEFEPSGGGDGEEDRDWEHEEDRQDDDDTVHMDKEEAQEQEKMEEEEAEEEGGNIEELFKPDDENEEAGAGADWPPSPGKGAAGAEGEAEDEDDDEEEDEDAFSPVYMGEEAAAAGGAGADPAAAASQEAAAAAAAGAGSPGAAAGASAAAKMAAGAMDGKKRKAEWSPGQPPAKRANLEIGKRTSPLPKGSAQGPAQAARPGAASVPASAPAGASGGSRPQELTEAAVRTVLGVGPLSSKDLVNKFKHLLKTEQDKKRFQEILRSVGKMQTHNGQKVIVLKS